jgi:hypothetical protein
MDQQRKLICRFERIGNVISESFLINIAKALSSIQVCSAVPSVPGVRIGYMTPVMVVFLIYLGSVDWTSKSPMSLLTAQSCQSLGVLFLIGTGIMLASQGIVCNSLTCSEYK